MVKHEKLLDVMHLTAKGSRGAGVMDTKTMLEFEALCLPPVQDYSADQIKRLRLRSNTCQAVFDPYLNTSTSTVQKWGQGVKHPDGPSLKLLNLVDRKGLEILA
ncbi:MAG: putative transcriptional regulator [Bradyrhizobium sp.]|jgi:putative transcriptional regulator